MGGMLNVGAGGMKLGVRLGGGGIGFGGRRVGSCRRLVALLCARALVVRVPVRRVLVK